MANSASVHMMTIYISFYQNMSGNGRVSRRHLFMLIRWHTFHQNVYKYCNEV